MSARILVVAEDASLRSLLERVLQGASFVVRAVSPYSDVVAEAKKLQPAVALVDLCPADGPALQAAARLRGSTGKPAFPVIFTGSGKESIQTATDARANHGDDFLQRPVPTEHLLQRLARYARIPVPRSTDTTTLIPGPAVPLPMAEAAALPPLGPATPPPTLIPGPAPVGVRPAFAAWGALSPAPVPSPAAHRPIPAVEPATGAFNPSLPGLTSPVRLLAPAAGSYPDGAMPALLWACTQQRITARLDLAREPGGDVERSYFFEDGRVVALRSREREDRFEDYLLNLGVLTPAQNALARSKGILSPRRLAAVLLEEGLLKPAEVHALARDHLKDRVIALFERGPGAFHAVADTVPEGERLPLDVTTAALTWAGIRRKFPLERLMSLIGGPSTLLTPAAAVDLSDAELELLAQRAVGALDGAHTLEDVAGSLVIPLELVYQAAFLLLSVNAARIQARGLDAPSMPEARLRDAEIDRARAQEQLRRCRDCNYFEMLGLSRDASRAEVASALERAWERWDPSRLAGPALADLADPVLEIRAVLEEARQVLLEDELRARYRASLG